MKIFFFIFLFFIHQLYACEIFPKGGINFATSTSEKFFFAYSVFGNKNSSTFFSANNCSKISDTNKYLMISFGPQNQELTDRVKAYDIANRYRDSGCFIQNSPFASTDSFSHRKKYLDHKWHTIKSCIDIIISDEGTDSLNYPEKQPGCEYKILEKNKISFNGGFCFLKPTDLSQFKIEFKMKELCLSYDGLKKLGIKVFDFQSVLNFYSAKEPTGDSLDLTSISSIPLRFTISPNKNIFSVSDSATSDEPEFPSHYYLPDTHMGLPEASISRPGFIKMRVPLWVNNKCENQCANGFCQGLCDYSLPISGEIKLFEISDGENIQLDSSWFQGGIVLPNYQGEISGRTFEMSDDFLQVGKKYRIIMSFDDPKFDFEDMKQEHQRKITRNQQRLGNIDNESIPNIPSIKPLGTTSTIPEIVRIQEINFKTRLNDSFEDLMTNFSGNFTQSYWPPFFNKICSSSKCGLLEKNFMTLIQEFKVSSFDEETKMFKIEVLQIKRESSLLKEYEINNPVMPKIFCRR